MHDTDIPYSLGFCDSMLCDMDGDQSIVVTAGDMMSRHGQWTLYLNSPRAFGAVTSNTNFMSMQERTTVRTMSTLLADQGMMGTGA